MSRSRTMIRVWVVLAGVALAAACGGGDSTTAPTPVPPPPDPTPVPASPTTVTVSPLTAELDVGETVQLAAVVRDQNSSVMAGAAVTWTSSASSVATVDPSGLVTGVAEGTATITASAGGAQGTARITVVSVMQPVVSVEVSSPAELNALGEPLQLGETLQLSAEALDENGQAVAGVEFSWKSSNTSVATVDATGLVTGVAEGTATITASAGDVQATVEITVVSAMQPAVSVEVSPSAETIALGETLQLSAEALDEKRTGGSGCGVLVGVERHVGGDGGCDGSCDGDRRRDGDDHRECGRCAGNGADHGGECDAAGGLGRGIAVRGDPRYRHNAAVVGGSIRRKRTGGSGCGVLVESNNTPVATVDASGLVTGVAEGSATIFASAGGVQGRAHIAVVNPVASPDREILVALYNATDGPNWGNSDNWLTGRAVWELVRSRCRRPRPSHRVTSPIQRPLGLAACGARQPRQPNDAGARIQRPLGPDPLRVRQPVELGARGSQLERTFWPGPA